MKLHPKFVTSCQSIDEFDWQRCFASEQPFTHYHFINTLETSGCVSQQTGWQPCHLVLENEQQQVVAIVILYIKSHSYGEYLFDWSWADAFQQHGIAYYPKIVSAIPFTPVTGQRFGIADEFLADKAYILGQATQAINALAKQIDASMVQCLFLPESYAESLQLNGWLKRCDVQYHWFNRDYQDFSDFLSALNARKRKSINKERQAIVKQGITVKTYLGEQLNEAHWQTFYHFYQATYIKRSGHDGYLSSTFFEALANPVFGITQRSALVFAYRERRTIAAALFFYDDEQLYGRYWGAEQAFNNLHFELCYYQGIELCIKLGLSRFNAGAQGQHKLKRGFEPVYIHGSYRIYQPIFADAIADFIEREEAQLTQYVAEAQSELPYKHIC